LVAKRSLRQSGRLDNRQAAQMPPVFILRHVMADANLYSTDGKHSFYQNGDYFYSMKTGETLFYPSGKHLYSMDGVLF